MTRDYDTQLLESVAVRRRRLRDAVMFGRFRTRRTLDENINKIIAGLCVAAVACAGCVGFSLVRTQLRKQKTVQTQQTQSPANPDVPVPADWVGTQVTVAMLRDALDNAHVPPSLYVLPGQPKPTPARTSSYYVLVKGADQFTAGTVEGRQGRIAAQFTTEDEACRWMYEELVVKEAPPVPLTPQQEQQAAQHSAALVRDVKGKIARSAGMPLTYTLNAGTLVDAFGQEGGSALFPDGTPFGRRGLPKAARVTVNPQVPRNYYRYRVVRPFQVNAALAQPAGHATDGGVRFTLDAGLFPRPPALATVRWLLGNGYVVRVVVTRIPD